VEALTLAGNAANQLHNRRLAVQYYSKLVSATKNTPTSANAMLAMAKIEEERFNFAAAGNDYLAYMAMPSKITGLDGTKEHALKKRVLVLSWLSGDSAMLGRMLHNRTICDKSLGAECNRYQALSVLMGSNQISGAMSTQAAGLAERSSPEVRSIYAAIALENSERLSMDKRHQMIHQLSANWKSLDEMSKFSLIARISQSVPHAFALDRDAIERSGKITSSEKTLTRRLNLTKEVETSATAAAKLPLSRIRALVLNEVAWIYNDLSDGIRRLPPPKKLNANQRLAYQKMVDQMVAPFENKAQQIRGEAYRLASDAGVESEVYDRIASDFFRGSMAGQAGQSATTAPKRQGEHGAIDMNIVRSVDDNGSWRAVDLDTAEPSQILRYKWAEAIDRRQWAQVAFFAEEAKEKNLLTPEVTGVAKAVSIASAGARAEGAMALTDLCHGGAASKIKDACKMTRYN
jgi:hypothetical protein